MDDIIQTLKQFVNFRSSRSQFDYLEEVEETLKSNDFILFSV